MVAYMNLIKKTWQWTRHGYITGNKIY